MSITLLGKRNRNLDGIFSRRPRRDARPAGRAAVRQAAFEVLEGRQLMSAAAPNYVVIADNTQNFGDTRRALNYYDVSNLTGSSTAYFNQTPSLTIWTGYEITNATGGAPARNYEEISGFDLNPTNGDTYVLSFDSGPTGVADPVGDTQGDYDLYRYNFTKAYSDQVTQARPAGVMYTDTTSPDFNATTGTGINYATAYGGRPLGPTGLPNVTSADAGVPDGRSNADADPSNDFVWVNGLVDKIGEVARVGGSSTPFFDQQEIQFVDPQTLLLMENTTGSGGGSTGGNAGTNVNQDYQIRSLERISTSAGSATVSGTTGGYNGNTTESWGSVQWSGDNFVDMDNFAVSGGLSEVDGMKYVARDGTQGAWVSDRDGGGDDFSFFALDFATHAVQKQELQEGTSPFPTGFALDEDPTVNANTNDGDLDFFNVDQNGKLIITEGGFNDTPKTESKVITRAVTDYSAGDSDANARTEVQPGGWTATSAISPTVDDDNATTDTRFGVYDRGQNYIYYFDTDSSSTSDDAGTGVGNPNQLVADVYVVDASTGAVVYQELDAVNHFFSDANQIRSFTLGDYTGDGKVQADDVDFLAAQVASSPSALTAERYDLDGDNVLTTNATRTAGTAVANDLDYLVRRVAATEYGDVDLSRTLDSDDRDIIVSNVGTTGGWAAGDVDGSGTVDADDLDLFDLNVAARPSPSRV